MQKEIYNFTAATSGDEHVDLPRDYPLVSLMLNSTIKLSDCHELITKMKLSCDSDKFIPVSQYTKHYQEQYENRQVPLQMRCMLYRKNTENPQFPIYYNPRITYTPKVSKRIVGSDWMWSGAADLLLYNDAGAAIASEEQIWATIIGGSLHNTIYLPFGIIEDPESYFSVDDWEEITLILTQAAAGAVKVCLQQLRSYAVS